MLEIKQVSKAFGGSVVLSDVSLEIHEGEFFSLLGPSGSGKTTLLRILAGFERIDSGDVLLGGVSVARRPAHARPFNMVFQKYALFPHMNVRQNVAFGLEVKGMPRETIKTEVDAALDLVSMEGMGDRRVTTLSGGQQQRVALARALVLKPRVLLLDEPLSALDLSLRQKMQVELRALQRRLGMTFVYVTHAQDEALAMSDRVAVMSRSKVEQVGRPEDLYATPATPFVATFVGASNRLTVQLSADHGDQATARVGTLTVTTRRVGPKDVTLGELLVRPERCRLEGGEHTLSGTVRQVIFKGATREVEVEIGGAESPGRAAWTVSVGGQAQVPAVGDRIRVGFDARDALITASSGAVR